MLTLWCTEQWTLPQLWLARSCLELTAIPIFGWGERGGYLLMQSKRRNLNLNHCFSLGAVYIYIWMDNSLLYGVITDSSKIYHCWSQSSECQRPPLSHCETQWCTPIFPALPGNETAYWEVISKYTFIHFYYFKPCINLFLEISPILEIFNISTMVPHILEYFGVSLMKIEVFLEFSHCQFKFTFWGLDK